ncbi:putative RNA polymerase II subunit B1 CTD phosphatase RPAP2 homolog isoform X2 [Sesamum indicum]|uniref:RNA polymerase II subunit B1 CTD phosphatase RPAP2 homolog n=1 Tax=Sesamum indicum TaxID=4182 RepID=A0A6I9TUW1_SESIN|nr:putative RNA polymerase II subunit B1 CTD phosphatase RPAP2 homolog isoform X2 [Sesamum indicum]
MICDLFIIIRKKNKSRKLNEKTLLFSLLPVATIFFNIVRNSNLEMKKDEVLTVKDAVHKLQLSLLEGINNENQLSAAGSLICRSDYQDVVTERTIINMCGYPLCSNSLPSERPRKGRYRISLKEHKVYDLQETYLYCSSSCLINSRAFAASLQEERSSSLNPATLNEVLKLFDGLSLDSAVDMGNGDLGLSELKIEEKTDTEAGEVSLEEWIGPSNAIDGYVPRNERNLKPKQSSNLKKGARQEQVDILSSDLNFTSTIITQDEYSISKSVPLVKDKESKGKVSINDVNSQGNQMEKPDAPLPNVQETKSKKSDKHKHVTKTDDKLSILEAAAGPSQNDLTKEENGHRLGKECASGATILKSSLKTSDSKKATRSVTWADAKTDGDGQNLCEFREVKDGKGALVTSHSADQEVGDESYRIASAEACARALSQAAEAVATGQHDVSDAVSEAGVIILPPPHEVDEAKHEEIGDVTDTDPVLLKWPPKPGFSNADLFDSEDSWYDSPPEGFSLTLSPFSTMFMALFAWITSSSLAYIYGKEESFHEEYISVNGREYPHKVVMPDGRSSEIKQTLAGCLARALPGLVAELRLPIPMSTIEQGMGRLLDTMSFIDPLPAFRMKQWQVIVLLFLDALSVSRIPALTPYLMGRRILLPKVLEGAQISAEEFEIMKDLIIPLGRVPQFSTQSGG